MPERSFANALLLGGGAPTLTLQSGALAAFSDKGLPFDLVSTAGAGMVIGLLYLAPRGKSPRQALEDTKEMGVHDTLYNLFPVNFKVFHKPGSMADAYRRWLQSLPRVMPGQDDASRLMSDWMQLAFSAMCPSDLSMNSMGLCDHAPWIEEIVDFDKMKQSSTEFYMNAYCIEDEDMEVFSKEKITPAHFRAALAFPFIYPPFKLGQKTYIEGSAIDTLCFRGLLEHRKKRRDAERDAGDRKLKPLKYVVIFDVLSSKNIIRPPRSLYDAWVMSIMIPLVEIAKNDKRMFENVHMRKWSDEGIKLELLSVNFEEVIDEVCPEHWPHVLDWSYSNLSKLFDVGYEAGLRFYEEHGRKLAGEAQPEEPTEAEARTA